MKRREFIERSLAGSAGVLLASSTLSAIPFEKWIAPTAEIPLAGTHVRHGLFNPLQLQQTSLPSWFSIFERHVFLKNGMSRGELDLETFTFHAMGHVFSLHQLGSMWYLTTDEPDSAPIPLDETKSITLEGLDCRVLKTNIDETLSGSEAVLIGLKGTIQCDHQGIRPFEVTPLQGKEMLSGSEETLALLIQLA